MVFCCNFAFFFTENSACYAGLLLAPAEDLGPGLFPPPIKKKTCVFYAPIKSQSNLKFTEKAKYHPIPKISKYEKN